MNGFMSGITTQAAVDSMFPDLGMKDRRSRNLRLGCGTEAETQLSMVSLV